LALAEVIHQSAACSYLSPIPYYVSSARRSLALLYTFVLLLLLFSCSQKKYIATNSLLAAAHRAAGKFLQAYAEHEKKTQKRLPRLMEKHSLFRRQHQKREEFILIKHTHTIERKV
jgi:hypothetical protein